MESGLFHVGLDFRTTEAPSARRQDILWYPLVQESRQVELITISSQQCASCAMA